MNKPFKIWINSRADYFLVLKKMESEGIVWVDGSNPLAHKDYELPRGLFVRWHCITYSTSENYFNDQNGYKTLTVEEYIMRDKMTKSDLADWMIVEMRSKSIYLVDKTHGYFLQSQGHMPFDKYTDDLKCSEIGSSEYDVMRVFTPKYGSEFLLKLYLKCTDYAYKHIEENLNLVWERDETPVEMTIAEIEEKLGIKNLKIIKEKEDE